MKPLTSMLAALTLVVSVSLTLSVSAQTATPDPCVLPEGVTTDPAPYFVGMGDAHGVMARHSLAIIDYTCAVQADPTYAPAYARRAVSETALGDGDAAMADFDQAIALDETLVEAYVNRGMFYAQAGNFGLALADFSLALALEPDNMAALNNRAIVNAIEGNFDLALADLEQALDLDPNEPATYATQGAVYSALAAQSYQQFLIASGSERALLPAGSPGSVLAAVDDSLRTGNYNIWLALMRQGN